MRGITSLTLAFQKKTSLSWRALRIAARDGQLHHFAKIGLGDVDLLIQEMSAKRATPNPKRRESSPSTSAPIPEKAPGGDIEMAVSTTQDTVTV
jgi:hypothetical protein